MSLDFKNQQVEVIEVTTAYDLGKLVGKVADREKQWFTYLKEELMRQRVIGDSWGIGVRIFVRKDRGEYFKSKFVNADDVHVECLEEIAFSWKWSWDDWSRT